MRPLIGLLLLVTAGASWAQEPDALDSATAGAETPAVQLGLFGFGVRGGVDFEDDGQAVFGVAFDVGHLFSERLRLRPSGELGVLSGANTYVANLEALYRFTPDTDVAVPYVGAGVALAGRGDCAVAPDCPALWLQFALGFEVWLREHIAWVLEYHPADAFRRQRVFIGLTTRRGS